MPQIWLLVLGFVFMSLYGYFSNFLSSALLLPYTTVPASLQAWGYKSSIIYKFIIYLLFTSHRTKAYIGSSLVNKLPLKLSLEFVFQLKTHLESFKILHFYFWILCIKMFYIFHCGGGPSEEPFWVYKVSYISSLHWLIWLSNCSFLYKGVCVTNGAELDIGSNPDKYGRVSNPCPIRFDLF